MKIGCVLLAAGNARRFGSNKLTAQLDGISLIRRAMDAVPGGLVTVVVSQYPEILALAGEYGFAVLDYEWANRPDFDDDKQFFDGFHLDTRYGLPQWVDELFADIG